LLSTKNISGFHTTGCEQQFFFPNISTSADMTEVHAQSFALLG
jgi:hypothetical protein